MIKFLQFHVTVDTEKAELVLAEVIPKHIQRLYMLIDTTSMPPETLEKLIKAEEKIYSDTKDSMVNWDSRNLKKFAESARFSAVKIKVINQTNSFRLEHRELDRWFAQNNIKGRLSYASRLAEYFSQEEIGDIKQLFYRQLDGKHIMWSSRLVILKCLK